MRKVNLVLMLMSVFLAQQAFADVDSVGDSAKSKPCGIVAHACSDAGFVKAAAPGKHFWFDCMKPILLGHAVSGVKVDADAVEACRTNKIAESKKELNELEAADKK
jgi:hypothetical protein